MNDLVQSPRGDEVDGEPNVISSASGPAESQRGFRKENAGCSADRQKCGTDAGSDAKQWKTATISIGAGSFTTTRRHGVVLRRPAKIRALSAFLNWDAAPIMAVLHHCAVKFAGGDVGTRTTDGE